MLPVVACMLALTFMWRLSLGPIPLNFANRPIATVFSAGLGDMSVAFSDIAIETARGGGLPRLLFRNIRLTNGDGRLIARAPRARIGLDGLELLAGRVRLRRLELIGPQILIQRTLSGDIRLGFGSPETGGGEAPADMMTDDAATTISPPDNTVFVGRHDLMVALAKDVFSSDHTAVSALTGVVISDASVSLYDAVNRTTWHASKANLVFSRSDHGVTLVCRTEIPHGPDRAHLELVANYISQTGRMSITARVRDFIPAHAAARIFSLSDLAEVKVPLSGEVHIALDGAGGIIKADGVLTTGAGHVDFPDFIARPVRIDGGVLHLFYEPETGKVIVRDSAISIEGSQTVLSGVLSPVHTSDGLLGSVAIDFHLRQADPHGGDAISDGPTIRRLDFKGRALVLAGRLDVDELKIQAGGGVIRLHGGFADGPEAVGVNLEGRIDDLPLDALKLLWPPILAPGAREWISGNILSGRVASATFKLHIPSEIMEGAIKGGAIPDEMVDFRFALADVTARYLNGLPLLSDTAAKGRLQGNRFDLMVESGHVTTKSGKQIGLVAGRMSIDDLVTRGAEARFTVQSHGSAQAIVDFTKYEPLASMAQPGFDVRALRGDTRISLDLKLPLLHDVSRDQVTARAAIDIDNVHIPRIADGVGIDGGAVHFDVTSTGATGGGDVTLNGVTARLNWTARFNGKDLKQQDIVVKGTLDDKARAQLGINLDDFMSGPIMATMTANSVDGKISHAHVSADLSKARLYLTAIGWRRPASGATRATFDLGFGEKGAIDIRNLVLHGKGLEVKGALELNAKGEIVSAALPKVDLDVAHDLSVKADRGKDGVLTLKLNAGLFDARALIDQIFACKTSAKGRGVATAAGVDRSGVIALEARFAAMKAHRGVNLKDTHISARIKSGFVEDMTMRAHNRDDSALQLTLTAKAGRKREVKLTSGNGGAILRGLDLYDAVEGGELQVSANLGAPGQATPASGRLKLRHFAMSGQPTLPRFSKQGHPKTSDKPSGPRHFTSLSVPFSVDDRGVHIEHAVLKGGSIGVAAQGTIDIKEQKIAISGTIIPIYALNSLLSAIPVLGTLLTGGEGEGIFAITFTLSGVLTDPKMTLNPASIFALGVLRKLFQLDSPR